MSNHPRQAAILGGAFDPVTKGHVQIARLVLSAGIGISEVWIMPCYKHAFDKHMESSDHRLAMCRLAAGKVANVTVSDYEIRKRFTGGTYFLVRELLEENFVKGKYELSLVIGMDNANGFRKWIEHDRLANLVRFIVIPRAGYEQDPTSTWYEREPHIYLDSTKRIMNVSSTEARTLLARQKDEDAALMLDPDVLEYIKANGLYSRTRAS